MLQDTVRAWVPGLARHAVRVLPAHDDESAKVELALAAKMGCGSGMPCSCLARNRKSERTSRIGEQLLSVLRVCRSPSVVVSHSRGGVVCQGGSRPRRAVTRCQCVARRVAVSASPWISDYGVCVADMG